MANLKYIGKNILNHDLEVKKGNIIGDHTEVIKVTVVSDGGNKYAFEGATAPDFTIDEGKTYRFDLSDSTNDGHPFRFSITENGSHGGGSTYSTGVTVHGTPGVKGAYTEINVTKVTPNNLYYYCTAHSGMGNDALLLKNDFLNLHRVSGSAVSTGSFGKIIVSEMSNSDLKVVSSSISTRLTTEEGNVDTLQARDLIAGTGLTGGGTLASDRTFNVVGGTGITANANDIEIDFSDSTLQTTISGSVTSVSSSLAGRITTEEGNVDTLQARDLIAGAGLTGGGTLASDRTFNVGAGTGVTVNANDVAIGQAVATSDNVTFGSVTTTGNISGSSTSTGSFGAGYIDNKLGIGTTSPVEALHVAGKAYIRRTGTATAHGDTDLFVADSTAGGSTAQLQILGGASGQSFLYFSDTNSYSVGGIKYYHSDNRMNFRVNDTDILDITSTKISGSSSSTGSFGAVAIGKGTADNQRALTVVGNVQLENNNSIYFKRSSGTADPYIKYDSSDNFSIFNPVAGEIQFSVGSGKILDIESTGINFNGSKSITTSTGGGVITVNGNSGVILKSGTGGGSGPIQFMHGSTVVSEVTSTMAISGSATSTGSFGRLEVASTASFGAIITSHISASHYHGQIGARYVHSQGTPSTTWSIPHNLGTQYPNVTVYNSDSEMIIPTSVTAHGGSTMTLTFSEAVGGAAMLGLGGGSDNITGRTFNFDQETASTIWRVTHSLGEQYPAITIYDENDEVIVPGRIHATNPGETSIYFEHATSGHGHFSVGNGLPGINSDNAGNFMRINSDGTQIEYVTSTQNVTGSFPISGSLTLTGSMFVSETGSFGRIGANVISASIYQGQIGGRYVHSQGSPSTTWIISHNLGIQHPNVTVYNSDNEMVIPTSVTANGGTLMTLTFSEAIAGSATLSSGGAASSTTGRTFMFNQDSAALLWRATHSLGERYPAITVYDDENNVIIPERIHAVGVGNAEIYFEHATSGNAHFSVGNGLPGVNENNAGNFMKVNSDGTAIEYVLHPAYDEVTGSFSISGSLSVVGPNAGITVEGPITARELIISSSVTHMTHSFSSGSTIFGDTLDDTHQFTGSLDVSGSISATSIVGTFAGSAGTETSFSGSAASTGSFGALSVGIGSTQLVSKATIHDSHQLPFLVQSTHADFGRIMIDGVNGDSQVSFASNSSTKWSIGNDDTNDSFVMRTGFGAFGTNDKLSLDTSGNLEVVGAVKGTYFQHPTINNNTIIKGNNTGIDVDIQTSAGNSIAFFEASDRKVILGGDISGSSTSTGSFGQGYFANKLGIGTTSPDTELHLASSEPIIRFTDTDDNNYHHIFASSDDFYISADRNGTGAGNLIFRNNGTNERMRIDSSGRLGIGEASPDSPLHLTYADNTTSTTATGTGQQDYGVKIENTSTTNGAFSQLHLRAGTADGYIRYIYEGTTNTGRLGFFVDNANDVKEAFSISNDGKQISGSSTSTGSFGRVEASAIDATTTITTPDIFVNAGTGVNNGLFLKRTGNSNGLLFVQNAYGNNSVNSIMSLDNSNTGNGTGQRIDFTFSSSPYISIAGVKETDSYGGSAALIIKHDRSHVQSDSKGFARFSMLNVSTALGGATGYTGTGAAAAAPSFFVSTGSIYVETGNVSGSATSTGSFGIVHVNGAPLRNDSGVLSFGLSALGANTGNYYNTAFGTDAMSYQTTAERNTGVGYQAGRNNVSGNYNVFMGFSAGRGATSGTYHSSVGIGYNALYSVNTANKNTAVGSHALYQIDKGVSSVAVGEVAGFYATGSYNTFVGAEAGKGGTTSAPYSSGGENTAVGYQSLTAFTTGKWNVAVGGYAGDSITTGQGNVLLGYYAGSQITTGIGNTFVGEQPGSAHDDSNYNTIIGYRTSANGTSGGGDNNTIVGAQAGGQQATMTGGSNTILGMQAMQYATSAVGNISIGWDSANALTTGDYNIFMGYSAGSNTTDVDYAVVLGFQAGNANMTSNVDGTVAIGYRAANALTSGPGNIAIGSSAGLAMTTNSSNTIIGYGAFRAADAGEDNNVVIGLDAGAAINHANSDDNVLIGFEAGYGGANSLRQSVAIGSQALKSTAANASTGTVAIGYYAGSAITSAAGSTLLGYEAGKVITTGTGNTLLGYQAGVNLTNDRNNTLIGYLAGEKVGTGPQYAGEYNTMVGSEAGQRITGSANVIMGYQAGHGKQGVEPWNQAASNVILGYQAGYLIENGGTNILIGHSAGYAASGSVSTLTAIGHRAGYNSTGGYSVYVGRNAGEEETGAYGNTAVGNNAQVEQKIGSGQSYNSSFGYLAAQNNVTGTYNTMIGAYAGWYNTASSNTALGVGALQGISVSQDFSSANVAIGGSTFTKGIIGGLGRSVAVGYEAGRFATGSANTFVGFEAGYGGTTSAPYSSGTNNIAMGYEALKGFTTANNNIAIGTNALDAITAGNDNVAIGKDALGSVTLGENSNVAIGYYAMRNMNEGTGGGDINGNIAIGYDAFKGGNLGSTDAQINGNIAIGMYALDNTTAGNHLGTIAIGKEALTAMTTAASNTAVGYQAGDTLTTGGENTIVGYGCDVASNDNNNNVIIGNNLTATDKNNAVFIGNNTNHIENDFNADATWNYSSDVRQKTEIEDDTLGLEFINKIRPVVYKHKSPSEFPKEWSSYDADDKEAMGGDKVIHGLIAQEVKEALDEADVDSFGGWSVGDDGRQRVSREMFITPLIKSVQELSKKVENLEEENDELKKLIKDKLGD